MRWDLTGIFWDDYVEPHVAAVKEKRTPPDPFWLRDDYLPNLDQALAHVPNEMTNEELAAALANGDRLIWDTEFYLNYALIGFRHPSTGKVVRFAFQDSNILPDWQMAKLRWILESFTVIGFNDTLFDIPMVHAVLAGYSTQKLMACVNEIIFGETGQGTRPWLFYRRHKLTPLVIDNIDLIALTPLGPGLKTCAGRLHAPRMADLPFPVGTNLNPMQIKILDWYWENDLQNTELLYNSHKTAIELREILTTEYGVDVRSKSDPQIAEQVIRKEIQRMTGRQHFERAKIVPWRSFRYKPPSYLRYQSPTMQWVLDFICRQEFVVDEGGSPIMPEELSKLELKIGESSYTMGIGGLHSKEKRVVHIAGDTHELSDNDVTSYYPSFMIQQKMYPPNVGPEFSYVFERIVNRRVAAKRAGDKATAETLKIVANGTFGKTGERGGHSIVYYPEMMIQVTVSGQLSLLMLIERLELTNVIKVVSANTDGIMILCPKEHTELRDQIMRQWEKETGLELESKMFKAVYTRDVNNYIALYTKPDEKDQSAFRYGKSIGAYRKVTGAYPLKWNPACEVCAEAVMLFLAIGQPVEQTIRECKDVTKFIEVRLVRGGAVKDGEYLGKAIRWYYSTEAQGEIINAKNGHTVARSDGAKPCLMLPKELPSDLDHEYYINRALGMLADFSPK